MPEDIVVVGAGGFGRETLDVIEAINAASITPIWRVVGVVDDSPAHIQVERLAARGYEHLGGVADALQRLPSIAFTIGIGSPALRSNLVERLEEGGWAPATLVHPVAVIGSRSVIGVGSIVCSGVQLSTNTHLGRYVHLNPGAIVGHDVRLGGFVSINPGAIISGEVDIEERALVGAGAVILQGLRVGADAIVGANACVTKDIARSVVVKGVPAR